MKIKTKLFIGLVAALISTNCFSVYADSSDRWIGSGNEWRVTTKDRFSFLENTWFQDIDSNWYLIGSDTYMLGGLVKDQSTGKIYLMNPNHDGTYGRMLSADGNYNFNGHEVSIRFNQAHDGSFGAILTDVGQIQSAGISMVELPSIPIDSEASGSNSGGSSISTSSTSDYGIQTSYNDHSLNNSDFDKEYQVFEIVNKERAKKGVGELEYDSELSEAARLRAHEVYESFSHTRPDGRSFDSVLDDFDISYNAAGENIALNYSPSAVMDAWMHSEGHKANILRSLFHNIGVGHYNNYWVQIFTN